MDRRLVAGAATGAAMLLLVLAASSGPVRLWITPPADVRPSSLGAAGPLVTFPPPDLAPPDRGDPNHWGDVFLQLLGVLLIVLAATVAVWIVRAGMWPRLRRSGMRKRLVRQVTALPEVAERELAGDVEAARVALAGGSRRNAIVACWMQLERDAAAAGLPSDEAETSTEYVERMVAASSVDPAPIRELAALYREARFSRHELRDDHRARALAALNRVEAVLRPSVVVVRCAMRASMCASGLVSVSLAATNAPGGSRIGRHRRGRFGGDPGDGRPLERGHPGRVGPAAAGAPL